MPHPKTPDHTIETNGLHCAFFYDMSIIVLRNQLVMRSKDSYIQEWNEMVFENRNKDYGAYFIRSTYSKHVLKGLIYTCIVIITAILLPKIIAFFNKNEQVSRMVITNSTQMNLTPPPPIDINIKMKPTVTPTVKPTTKFLPPEVTDKEVQEEVPTVKELEKNMTDAEPVKGTDENASEAVEGDGGEGDVYDMSEKMPEYIGGPSAMAEFISNNIRYPASAQRMRISGTVFVSFLVNVDGTISDVRTIKGIFADCDREAERVVQLMPLWKPGRQSGKPVKVKFAVPIKFSLGVMSVQKTN